MAGLGDMFERLRKKFGIGEYPPEYNPKIHGPYYPNRYYRKADTKFTEVKLGDLYHWIRRQDYHPITIARYLGRSYWNYQMKWMMTKKPSLTPFVQVCLAYSLFYFVNQYPKYNLGTPPHKVSLKGSKVVLDVPIINLSSIK